MPFLHRRLRQSVSMFTIALFVFQEQCLASFTDDQYRRQLSDPGLYAGAAGAFEDILDGTSPFKTGAWKRRRLAGSWSSLDMYTTVDATAWDELQQNMDCGSAPYEVSLLFSHNHFALVATPDDNPECPVLAIDGYPRTPIEGSAQDSTSQKAFLVVQAHELNALGKAALATQMDEDNMLRLGVAPLPDLVAAVDAYIGNERAEAYHFLNNNCIHPLVDIINKLDALDIPSTRLLAFLQEHIEDMAFEHGGLAVQLYHHILKEDSGKLYDENTPMEAAVEQYLHRLVMSE